MDVLIALGTLRRGRTPRWSPSPPVFFPFSGVYFDTSAVIITLILVGRLLEQVTSAGRRGDKEARRPSATLPTGSIKTLRVDVPVEQVGRG